MSRIVEPKRMPGPPGSVHLMVAPIGPDSGAPKMVGPFAVVVHVKMPMTPPGMLPVDADVRPHPHIGLAAISYVLDGAVTHRDSLGNRREMRAGDLGATISGRGIVHSERFERNRLLGGAFEMFQLLLTPPDGHEDGDPSFFYRAHEEHPTTSADGVTARWLLPAPPATAPGLGSPALLADATLDAGARWATPDVAERAVYVQSGVVEIEGERATAGQVVLIAPGEVVRAPEAARVLAFGGPRIGERFMWWNYLHSSRERIEAAKAEWRAGRVPLPEGDTESFTPAPPDDGRPLWHLNKG